MKNLILLLALGLPACTLADDAVEDAPDAALDVTVDAVRTAADALPDAGAWDAPPPPPDAAPAAWTPILGRYSLTGTAGDGTCPTQDTLPFVIDVYHAGGDYQTSTDPDDFVRLDALTEEVVVVDKTKTNTANIAVTARLKADTNYNVVGTVTVKMTFGDGSQCDRAYAVVGAVVP